MAAINFYSLNSVEWVSPKDLRNIRPNPLTSHAQVIREDCPDCAQRKSRVFHTIAMRELMANGDYAWLSLNATCVSGAHVVRLVTHFSINEVWYVRNCISCLCRHAM